jgi:hypothetical protein
MAATTIKKTARPAKLFDSAGPNQLREAGGKTHQDRCR